MPKVVNGLNPEGIATHHFVKLAEVGKEYYCGIANHVAIIKKTQDGTMEYLELQSDNNRGWHIIDDDILKRRFDAQKSHTRYGIKFKRSNQFIDIEKLCENSEFKEMLGYINTDIAKRKSGAGGGIK